VADADPLTFRTGHDDKLGCDSTSPKDRYLAFPNDWGIAKFGVIDVCDA
jgi:hypothetical protein